MADTKLFGNDEIGGTTVSSTNKLRMQRFQAIESGTCSEIRIYLRSAFRGRVAIYSDINSTPNTLLSNSNYVELMASEGWETAPIPTCNIVAGEWYWLAFAVGAYSNVKITSSARVTALSKIISYSEPYSFPNPAGGGYDAWYYNVGIAAWGTLAAGGAGRLIGPSHRIGGPSPLIGPGLRIGW